MKRPTLKDIAQEAGVSAMTVSKALNQKGGISEATRAQILAIAERMNYSPNLIAKSLRIDETRTLGVVLSDSSEMVTSKVLRGIQDGASERGYSVIVSNTDNNTSQERAAALTLQSKQIDGLILVAPTRCSSEDLVWLQGLHIPFILLMRKNDEINVDTVINDNYLGGYQTVEHLAREGCRKLQFILLENSQSSDERKKGYEQAMRDYRIAPDACRFARAKPFIDSGYEAARGLLPDLRRFDALVCGCDTVAIGAMEALGQAGVRIPEDLRLIGYDGIEIDQYLRVPLSTIAQPLYRIGYEGTGILLDRIRYPDTAIRKVVLKSELIVRRSSHPDA